MANKPSYRQARSERKGTATMEIEGANDLTKPKTSFTDKNLDPRMEPAGENKVSTDNAKSDESIGPNPNAPKQGPKGTGFTKPDAEGLTKA